MTLVRKIRGSRTYYFEEGTHTIMLVEDAPFWIRRYNPPIVVAVTGEKCVVIDE